jgi:hypothetical protein
MTRPKSEPLEEAQPPEGYPYPDWAPEDDATFYVPEQLRADYGLFRPRPAVETQYWRDGAQFSTGYPFEAAIARAEAAGRDPEDFTRLEDFLRVHPADIIYQRGHGESTRYSVEARTHLQGQAGFAQWLHMYRLGIATERQGQREYYAARGRASA